MKLSIFSTDMYTRILKKMLEITNILVQLVPANENAVHTACSKCFKTFFLNTLSFPSHLISITFLYMELFNFFFLQRRDGGLTYFLNNH